MSRKRVPLNQNECTADFRIGVPFEQNLQFTKVKEDVNMKIDKKFVLREIAGEYIIIPTGKTALDFKGLITVNEVGVSIWKMLQNDVTLEELVQGILNEYEVEEEVAREDIQEFLDALIAGGILKQDV